jgi:signal transduction histidine kinase
MAELYTWLWAFRSLLTFAFALCIAFQTLAAVLCFFRRGNEPMGTMQILLELSILWQIFTCSLLHGQIVQAYDLSLIPPTGYAEPRIAAFAAVALFSTIVMVYTKKPYPLLIVAMAGITLPFVELYTGYVSAYLYLLAVLFWLVRSVRTSLLWYREIKTGLSALSVKNAIDSLHTGVMFCEKDGYVFLANTQMQQLMTIMTGKIQRNGKQLFRLLTLGEIDPRCRMTQLENQNVIILPDNTAWIFSLTELHIKSKEYKQMTATDITERWQLTAKLQGQNSDLMKRQEELKETIANLHTISREKGTQKAKIRIHDILSERLTLLRQAISKKQAPDNALILALAAGLLSDLKATRVASTPQDELDSLQQSFATIGVEVLFNGKLPEDKAIGQLFVDITREAITNAVRHGFATQVRIYAEVAENQHRLVITDNGRPIAGDIKEGHGIAGMRRRLKEWGGELSINTSPQFQLTIVIRNEE